MTTTPEQPSAGTAAAPPAPERSDAPPPRRPFRRRSSARLRITSWYVVLVAFALGLSIVAARQVLLATLAERIDDALVQEVDELRQLAGGIDPADGRPFGSRVERIFDVFLSRNIPAQNEAMLAIVDGAPYLRSPGPAELRLDRHEDLVRRWRAVSEPERDSTVLSDLGRLEHLAVPLRLRGGTEAVFVVAMYADLERAALDEVIRTAALAGLIALGLATLLAWGVAGRVLAPVRELTRTATAIGETDLERRIEVEGRDEIAELAATFNDMLDRLEAAFSSQRAFIDDAGHELRTPITIVRGHLELLEDDPEERRRTIALVLDELDRMSRMVEDMLLLAKAQQPDFLTLQTIDLERFTEDVVAKARALAPRDWRLDGSGRGRIVGDRQRLTQVLMQLAQNATQHTGEGAEIGLGSSLADGEVRLWVRDTGPGIPEDEHERIFDRFTRGRGGRRRSDGAGLGLAIVRAIAEAHSGRVELDSRPGAGARFTVVLPTDPPRGETAWPAS